MELVQSSRILSTTLLGGPGGRRYAAVEIACAAEFRPGQYLMIRSHRREVRWPYPYWIQKKTERGLVVLAAPAQDLFSAEAGDAVEYWGPRGRCPLEAGEQAVLVAEPATAYLLSAFVEAGHCGSYILIGSHAEAGLIPENPVYAATAAEAAALSAAPSAIPAATVCRTIAVLNPDQLEQFAAALPNSVKNHTLIFISNKKACGIDACKGCYLHSATERFGINVCCQGPYLPLSQIDFAADGTCFENFD